MTRVNKFWHGFRLIMLRIVLPVLILLWVGGTVAIILDKRHVRDASPDDYLKYTSFNVTGAYEGEDVNFTVCRDFQDRYHYEGDLQVRIVPNPDDPKTSIPVYSRPIGSTINKNPCEAKRIREVDFHHSPGTYKMTFRVCIVVDYGIQKCTPDVESNLYRIRPKPEELQSKIEYYQSLLDQLRTENNIDPGSLAPIQSGGTSSPQSATPSSSTTTNNTTNNTNNTTQTETCKPTKILGLIEVGCRN